MLRIATGQLGIGRRQISTVGASVAMSICADKRAVALPRMLENIEAELANDTVEATEREALTHRAELIRGLLAPRQSGLGEVLRRDRTLGQGATASRPWGVAYIAPSALAAAAPVTVSHIGC